MRLRTFLAVLASAKFFHLPQLFKLGMIIMTSASAVMVHRMTCRKTLNEEAMQQAPAGLPPSHSPPCT